MISDFRLTRISTVHSGSSHDHIYELCFKGSPEDDLTAGIPARGALLAKFLPPKGKEYVLFPDA
jgi:hypothetical protein